MRETPERYCESLGLGERSQPILRLESLHSSRGNSGPMTEVQRQPVMSVPSMPQTKDSRNSGEGPLLSGARREAASRKLHIAGLAN